uniref:Spermatogenesis-defective protein 39 homolog n=1 Tax=Cacopsylla melanoneura TaxID=428564 RepID=A0A8D9ABE5_9HEMI
MNLDDSDDFWNSSEIQNTSFNFDDEEEHSGNKNNTNESELSLSDLVSGLTPSGKSSVKLPTVDLYSLVSKESVDYILNGPSTNKKDHLFSPFQNKLTNQSSIDISNVVSNMCNGQDECLEPFKSLASKQQLLTCAIQKKNNNVILKVICFLAKTLKPNLMNEIFLSEPIAFDLYLNFLISKDDLSKAIDLLDILGFNRDAGMLQFSNCLSRKSNPMINLKSISNSYFLMDSDKGYIDNLIKLLEWQCSVNKKLNQSTGVACLSYAINNQPNDPKISTESLCKMINISDKLFHWIFLKEKCKTQQWSVISQLFVSKKWHGGKSVSTQVPVEDIIKELAGSNAPETELAKYLQVISNVSTKLALARKYKCSHLVVDILVDQKDRLALLEFKSQQPAQSESYFYAENALRNNSTKWKN